MNFEPTEEQKAILDVVRRFVRKEIRPLEQDLDYDADELPPEHLDRLTAMTHAMGLHGLGTPEEFGGPGIDLVTRTLMAVEMSQHRAGLYAPCYGVFGGREIAQLYEGTDYQREHYLKPMLRGEKRGFFALTEPSGGSDPARAIQMSAVRDGDDWILNGTKLYITGAHKSDFGITFAQTDKSKGRRGITCFIVDTDSPGFQIVRIVHGLRNSNPAAEIFFDNVRVPQRNVVGEVGGGFEIASERLARERIPYAASCLGVAIYAQEMAIKYAKERETFGAPLATRQGIQWMLVDNEIDIRQSLLMVLVAATKAERGERFKADAALAKLVATEAASRVVDRSMQIHGGAGVTKDLPFDRWYREMRIRRIGEGPSEVQRLIAAREIIGGSFK